MIVLRLGQRPRKRRAHIAGWRGLEGRRDHRQDFRISDGTLTGSTVVKELAKQIARRVDQETMARCSSYANWRMPRGYQYGDAGMAAIHGQVMHESHADQMMKAHSILPEHRQLRRACATDRH